MTDTTEQEALAEVNAAHPYTHWNDIRDVGQGALVKTLCRAIERHKIDIADLQAEYEEVCKLHEAFRQEVSDAIVFALKVYGGHRTALDPLRRFIIAKPVDPLAQAWLEAWPGTPEENAIAETGLLLAAIEKRGGKIVWGEG